MPFFAFDYRMLPPFAKIIQNLILMQNLFILFELYLMLTKYS